MDLLILANAADDVSAMETVPEAVDSPEEGDDIVAGDSLGFDSWTSLISEIEKTYSDNIKAISSLYESFLSRFPLCHTYWKRYAEHNARLCTMEKAVEIFERAVQSATYSVDLWVDYCSFSMLAFADPSDVRRIFERGLSFVGKDFLCHRLWDLYIRFELSQQQWSFLAHVLIRALKFPSKSLHKYYDNFREFAAFVEEEMSCPKICNLEPHEADSNVDIAISNDEIYLAVKELQDSSSVELRIKSLYKLITIGELFYHKSCQLHEKIDYFENYMDRDFFNAEPLDDEQLENWHNYLDFVEKQEDFDWAVKLYERCLIPCANYPEFWMRYVEFMESKGGRELANFALERATQVFLKKVSEVHIFNARFREKIGDIEGARAAFLLCDTESDSFIETAIIEANMEKRLGNLDSALDIFDKALKMAADKEKIHITPVLYIHLFRLKYLITGSADAATGLLLAGIKQVPHSRLLIEELINFAMMHGGSKYLDVVESIIATAITCGSDESHGLNAKDREDLSHLYLKFVDYCGTTHDIRKAWNRHIQYFPHLIRTTSSHKYPSNRLSNENHKLLTSKSQTSINHSARTSPNENHTLLTSKSQTIEPHDPTSNQYGKKDNDNSVKENTRFQQSEGNTTRKLRRLKRQSRNDASEMTELPLSKYDQIRTEQEEENEHEVEKSLKPVSVEKESNKDTMPAVTHANPSTPNRNPFPATESAKKQTETNEYEPGSSSHSPSHRNLLEQTDPQQIPSQNAETCKTNHIVSLDQQNPMKETLESNTYPVPNVQPLAQPVQPMVQYPVQSSEPSGLVQNPQAYNRMLQYQYEYQQNQNLQQWLQMQQWIQQQQQQQQQQQYVPQQYQFYQNQEQYQQYWLQVYQKQQEYNMQMQHYQQMPQDLQQSYQQRIAMMSNQIWNSSHDQQGQGMIPPHTSSVPYTQQISVNVVAQPMAATAPTNITSPSLEG